MELKLKRFAAKHDAKGFTTKIILKITKKKTVNSLTVNRIIIIVSRKGALHTGRILLHVNLGFYKILNNEMFVMKYFTERCKYTSIRV